MDSLTMTRFGPSGWLVRFADRIDEISLARCRGLLATFEEERPHGLRDLIPAYGELLLEFDDAVALEVATGAVKRLLARARPLPVEEARLHEIAVRYGGGDFEDLAKLKGLSSAELIDRHSAPFYSVYLIGFSPGFPYLGPLDSRLHVPRLAAPRARVPKGSVAIGGEHTGIYSISSPGGWRIIGQTEAELFAPARGDGAFLLRQGDRVKFLPVS